MILSPTNIQDDLHITIEHSASGAIPKVAAQRLLLMDPQGSPLAKPVQMPLDGFSALCANHAGFGVILQQLCAANDAAGGSDPKTQIWLQGMLASHAVLSSLLQIQGAVSEKTVDHGVGCIPTPPPPKKLIMVPGGLQ